MRVQKQIVLHPHKNVIMCETDTCQKHFNKRKQPCSHGHILCGHSHDLLEKAALRCRRTGRLFLGGISVGMVEWRGRARHWEQRSVCILRMEHGLLRVKARSEL